MATHAIRVPQPLSSEEIRKGIAVRIANSIQGLKEADRTNLRDAIWESLGKTCSLNRQSYAKFSVRWSLWNDPEFSVFNAGWVVKYDLDDFGRPVIGSIGGGIGLGEEGVLRVNKYEGSIDAVPPDQFRRETDQPIPQPQVVQPKPTNEVGVTKAVGRPRKVRET